MAGVGALGESGPDFEAALFGLVLLFWLGSTHRAEGGVGCGGVLVERRAKRRTLSLSGVDPQSMSPSSRALRSHRQSDALQLSTSFGLPIFPPPATVSVKLHLVSRPARPRPCPHPQLCATADNIHPARATRDPSPPHGAIPSPSSHRACGVRALQEHELQEGLAGCRACRLPRQHGRARPQLAPGRRGHL